MNTTPTASPSGSWDGRIWVSVAACSALACALAPLLPLLSITPWSSAIANAPLVALMLTVVTLVAIRHREARRERLMARLALVAVGVWALLFVAFGLALLYG